MSSSIQKILVAIDFSEITTAVLECAGEMAKAHDAELELLHVAAPDPLFVGMGAGPQTVRDQRANELRSERHKLRDYAKDLQRAGIKATVHLVEGSTVKVILGHAREEWSDLIIVGSHGHGPMLRAFLGSVSLAVLKEALCPVLIVPKEMRLREL